MKVERVSEHITNWIKNYADNAGISTLIIGISGGIDSSVVSALAVRTGLNVILVEMPIGKEYTEGAGTRHIKSLQEKFDNVQHEIVDLTEPFNVSKNTFVSQTNLNDNPRFELGLVNLASRLRMITLYTYANCHSGLVVGTGNKVEDFGVGFFTLGGDGQVDISPIADLMKSEVYSLGKFLGVNDEILEVAPNDGLWEDGRTDEDQLGASYDELEWAMNYVEEFISVNSLEEIPIREVFSRLVKVLPNSKLITERNVEVLNIYMSRHLQNLHKMVEIPVCTIPENLK